MQKSRYLRAVWHLINVIQRSPLVPRKMRTVFLKIGGCSIHSSSVIASGCFIGANSLVVDNNVVINIGAFLDGSAQIHIKEYVRFGPYVKILTGSHQYANSVLRRGPKSTLDLNLPVVIERGCWLGMGVMVMPGVVIREGCVIAAGAVVDRSTEPNGLYAGLPAKRIKNLSVEEDDC